MTFDEVKKNDFLEYYHPNDENINGAYFVLAKQKNFIYMIIHNSDYDDMTLWKIYEKEFNDNEALVNSSKAGEEYRKKFIAKLFKKYKK